MEKSESVKMEVIQDAKVEKPEKPAAVDMEASGDPVTDAVTSSEELPADVEMTDDVAIKTTASTDTTDKKKQENTYAAKKTVAQGMMDVALITANANQLRNLIEFQRNTTLFYFVVVLIAISMLLQIAVGVSLIFKGRYDLKGKSKSKNARMINNYVVVAIFIITIVNVFIAVFSISSTIEPLPAKRTLPEPTLKSTTTI